MTSCQLKMQGIAVLAFYKAMKDVPASTPFGTELLPLFHRCGDAASAGCWDVFDTLIERLKRKMIEG